MESHEQTPDPPALRETWRERLGKQATAEPPLPVTAPDVDGNEATTTLGPFLAALLRALSAWPT